MIQLLYYAFALVSGTLGVVAISELLKGKGVKASMTFDRTIYPPYAPETVDLLREAAIHAGVPVEWSMAPGVHLILQKESKGGQVGIPNYTFDPKYTTDRSKWHIIWDSIRDGSWKLYQDPSTKHEPSSATGLGQLIVANVKKYYPSGVDGIGDPLEEAIGILSYLKDRWHTPENLAEHYNKTQEGW